MSETPVLTDHGPGDVETVKASLAKLPSAAYLIACQFEEMGITGLRHVPHACPIARYLRRDTGLEVRVTVGLVYVGQWRTKMPGAVCQFIENFDNGLYKYLVKRTADV